jgi:RNA polymerase sigma-70 factor (ECF subfamily)
MYYECLLALAEQGNFDAFWVLTEHYLNTLFNKSWLLSGRVTETKRIISRGLIKAWTRVQSGNEHKYPAFISRAIVETALDALNKHGRDEIPEIELDRELAAEGGKLVAWFRQLNPLQRQVVVLRYFENLNLKEIVSILRKKAEQVTAAMMAALLSIDLSGAEGTSGAEGITGTEGRSDAGGISETGTLSETASECEYTRKNLCAYLKQDMDVKDGERIGLHIQHCSNCRTLYHRVYERHTMLHQALRGWVMDNRLPDGWGLDAWDELNAYLDSIARRKRLEKYWQVFGWKNIKPTLTIIALLLLFTLASPFFFWLASRLPYYGPWVSSLIKCSEFSSEFKILRTKPFFLIPAQNDNCFYSDP